MLFLVVHACMKVANISEEIYINPNDQQVWNLWCMGHTFCQIVANCRAFSAINNRIHTVISCQYYFNVSPDFRIATPYSIFSIDRLMCPLSLTSFVGSEALGGSCPVRSTTAQMSWTSISPIRWVWNYNNMSSNALKVYAEFS